MEKKPESCGESILTCPICEKPLDENFAPFGKCHHVMCEDCLFNHIVAHYKSHMLQQIECIDVITCPLCEYPGMTIDDVEKWFFEKTQENDVGVEVAKKLTRALEIRNAHEKSDGFISQPRFDHILQGRVLRYIDGVANSEERTTQSYGTFLMDALFSETS